MASPYASIAGRQRWTKAVAGTDIQSVEHIYKKRFPIDGMRIATAGSCFAQHIARNLRANGFEVLDKEPGPRGLHGKRAQDFGYSLYSARHGNIYTARRLLQLTQEALGLLEVPERAVVWEKRGRFYDALRSVEPDGLTSPEEVMLHRADHVRRFKALLSETDLFIFTFGLTEAWMHEETGIVYGLAPDDTDPKHRFKNFTFQEVYDDFSGFRALAHQLNPRMKFLVTVSPVPLAATYEDAHVLPATVHSKAILRAVAGQLHSQHDDIDYFPSFDILSTPFLGPSMFADNRRDVTRDGVANAMRIFFEEHKKKEEVVVTGSGDVVCEEALLEAFA